MAFVMVGTPGAYGDAEYHGLSTDAKPTVGVKSGSAFYELDTKTWFVYSEDNINPATSNGWWEA